MRNIKGGNKEIFRVREYKQNFQKIKKGKNKTNF